MSPPPEPIESEPNERALIDRALKALAPHFHAELAAWLLGERPIRVEALEPGLATVAERARDKLLRIELACVVVYLDEARYRRDPGCFEYVGALGTRLRVEYRVVKLWEVDPQAILHLESPDLCVLAPFLRGDKKRLCIESSRRIRRSSLPEGLKRDLLAVLSILAARKIADRGFLHRLYLEMSDMTGNYVIDLFLERGEQKGIEKGRAEGQVEGARTEARRVLGIRFKAVPDEVRTAIESLSSIEQLEALHDVAVTCVDLNAFRRHLTS